ncbi:Pentatricopeptide repeat-containing protein At1g11290, chloroplastic [Linum grandiflorum]
MISNQARLKTTKRFFPLSPRWKLKASVQTPDSYCTLPLVFKARSGLNAVDKGRKQQGRIRGSTHLIGDVRVCTAVIDFYCKCGFVEEAFQVFEEMRERDLVSWNAMIAGYVGCGYVGYPLLALDVFVQMLELGVKLDSVTILVAVQTCSELGCLKLGMEIHQLAAKPGYEKDLFIVNTLINMYSELNIGHWSCPSHDFSYVSHDATVCNKTKLGILNHGSDKEGPSSSRIQWQQPSHCIVSF